MTASSGGYPAYLNTNIAPALTWINGTQWMMSTANSGATTDYLYYSTNYGTTYTDATTLGGGLNAACTGSNLNFRSSAVGVQIRPGVKVVRCFTTADPSKTT